MYMKKSYGRGVGEPLICAADEEEDAALCYKKCVQGWAGMGPFCWSGCSGMKECGPMCTPTSGSDCYVQFKTMATTLGSVGWRVMDCIFSICDYSQLTNDLFRLVFMFWLPSCPSSALPINGTQHGVAHTKGGSLDSKAMMIDAIERLVEDIKNKKLTQDWLNSHPTIKILDEMAEMAARPAIEKIPINKMGEWLKNPQALVPHAPVFGGKNPLAADKSKTPTSLETFYKNKEVLMQHYYKKKLTQQQ